MLSQSSQFLFLYINVGGAMWTRALYVNRRYCFWLLFQRLKLLQELYVFAATRLFVGFFAYLVIPYANSSYRQHDGIARALEAK